MEVCGYVELQKTFSDEEETSTITIKYIVVIAPSLYNMLLRQPSLNKLGAIVSTIPLKMKFPSPTIKVITKKIDQRVARKCYENNLRIHRGTNAITTFMGAQTWR